jgi:hypothetical protein
MRRTLSALLLAALVGCSSQAPPPAPSAARYHVSYTYNEGALTRWTVDTSTGAGELVNLGGHRQAVEPPPGLTPAAPGRYAGALTESRANLSVLVYDTQTGASWSNGLGRDGWQKMP